MTNREPTAVEVSIAEALYADNLRQINENDKAKYAAFGHPENYIEMMQQPFEEAEPHVRKMYLSYASAAIKAMREPDGRMSAVGTSYLCAESIGYFATEEFHAKELWRLMVDAASPPEQP